MGLSGDGAILVVNVGSSGVKLRLLDAGDALLAERDLPAEDDLRAALAEFGEARRVGHRIVHGGPTHRAAVVVDDGVRAELEALVALAPLHQPPALAALDAARAALPRARHVACFDTAFHATLPVAASTYAIPRAWREELGVRRYGFHGLSHAYASRRVRELVGGVPAARLVTCHLGAGASLCAIRDGRSVDTTMGFTPLDGLVMATRSGSVDAGLVPWLVLHAGLDIAEVGDALERHSGLLGLAGTPDLRAVVEAAEAGGAEAQLALAVYAHRLRAGIGAMTASLGGLDAIAFTGGAGERSHTLRRAACSALAHLGIVLDDSLDAAAVTGADAEISARGASVRSFVIHAREDLEIAAQVRAVA